MRTDRKRMRGIRAGVLLLLLLAALAVSGCQRAGADPETAADLSVEAEESSDSKSLISEAEAEEIPTETKGSGSQNKDGAADKGQDTDTACPSKNGALRVEGTQLIDKDGDAVQLRGISTHGIAWFPQYVNEACFRQFHEEWNANVIRLAMYTAESGGYCTDGNREELKALVRSGVAYAKAQDLYVIVDWHVLSDQDPNRYREEAVDFFREMSGEFADMDHVLYEICNEPNGGVGWAQIKDYAEEVIGVIREQDDDAVVIVGTPNWSQYVDEAAKDPITDYDNVMYALHFYAATHKEDLRQRMVQALGDGLPVFVTEYGICDASGSGAIDEAEAQRWIETLDAYGVSYVAWNLSNKNETSAILSPACSRVSGFTGEDLSNSGKWLYRMLAGGSGAGQSAGAKTGAGQSAGTGSDAGIGQSTGAEPGFGAGQSAGTEPGSGTGSGSAAGQSADGAQSFVSHGMRVTMEVTNSWESGGDRFYQYGVTLENVSGAACSGWMVEIPFEGEISLSDGWNGEYSVSGKTLTISAKDYNSAVDAGGYVTDIGFILSEK